MRFQDLQHATMWEEGRKRWRRTWIARGMKSKGVGIKRIGSVGGERTRQRTRHAAFWTLRAARKKHQKPHLDLDPPPPDHPYAPDSAASTHIHRHRAWAWTHCGTPPLGRPGNTLSSSSNTKGECGACQRKTTTFCHMSQTSRFHFAPLAAAHTISHKSHSSDRLGNRPHTPLPNGLKTNGPSGGPWQPSLTRSPS